MGFGTTMMKIIVGVINLLFLVSRSLVTFVSIFGGFAAYMLLNFY